MIGKAVRWLILSTVALGLMGTVGLGAEPLPPRALARIGDHRFYHGPGIMCGVLSPDGRRIASAAYIDSDHLTDEERDAYDPIIVLWDVATGERIRELRVPRGSAYRLAFSPDNKRLAATYWKFYEKVRVAVFEVETGKLLQQLGDFENGVSYLQFSADSKQLRVSEWGGPWDGPMVSAWDAASGKRLHIWKPPAETSSKEDKEKVRGVRGMLSPDDKVVAWEMNSFRERIGSWGWSALRVHDAHTDKLLYQKKFKFDARPLPFAFSTDSKHFAVSDNHNLIVWETTTGEELVALTIPNLGRFALMPDGRHAVISERDGRKYRLRLWDLQTGKPSLELYPGFVPPKYHPFPSPQVFSADGKTLLLATNSTLRLFDTTTGKECGIPGHRAAVAPRFSADGRTLFTSCDERRCSWDVSGKEPALLRHEPRKTWEIGCLAHSANEQLFLDKSEIPVRVRETATGCVLRELEGARYPHSGLFSLDATRVLLWYYADEKFPDKIPEVFRLYDAKTGKASAEIKPVNNGYPVLSPNGRLVAWADHAGAVHLHDTTTGKVLRTLRSSRPLSQAEEASSDLLFSRDSKQMIVTTYLKNRSKPEAERWTTLPTRVFQISSGREIIQFNVNPHKASETRPFLSMANSPDGRLFAAAKEESGIIRLIEIASGQVRAEFAGHRHGVHGLAFAPDGKTLASGGEDNVVFLWDVTGVKTPTAVKKTPKEWWSDLASEDGKRAGVAIASLIRTSEQSILLLRQRLHPAEALSEKHLARLLADLDGDAFETREAASRELTRLGERAEAALRRSLMNRPSLEVRRRIEDLLGKFPTPLPPETLRILRAIEILEHIGTPAARQSLDMLAKGAPDARETQEAKRALDRLAKRGEQRKIDRRRMDP